MIRYSPILEEILSRIMQLGGGMGKTINMYVVFSIKINDILT